MRSEPAPFVAREAELARFGQLLAMLLSLGVEAPVADAAAERSGFGRSGQVADVLGGPYG